MSLYNAPLYNLANVAPELPDTYDADQVEFPFSNDDAIRSFVKAYDRVKTESFNAAAHPVAIMIGESSLSTSICFIPEQTIMIVDKNPQMGVHMQRYTDYFRISEDHEDWLRNIGLRFDESVMTLAAQKEFATYLENQIMWWHASKLGHALNNAELFRQSKELFQSKAIIPWCADITSVEDMHNLGDHLRARNAQVTLLNLTDVIPVNSHSIPNASVAADMLSALPLTVDAPILTASSCLSGRLSAELAAYGTDPLLQPTGPFYGLPDLRTRGGDSVKGPVAIPAYRQL